MFYIENPIKFALSIIASIAIAIVYFCAIYFQLALYGAAAITLLVLATLGIFIITFFAININSCIKFIKFQYNINKTKALATCGIFCFFYIAAFVATVVMACHFLSFTYVTGYLIMLPVFIAASAILALVTTVVCNEIIGIIKFNVSLARFAHQDSLEITEAAPRNSNCTISNSSLFIDDSQADINQITTDTSSSLQAIPNATHSLMERDASITQGTWQRTSAALEITCNRLRSYSCIPLNKSDIEHHI